jgi:hypothetical protein
MEYDKRRDGQSTRISVGLVKQHQQPVFKELGDCEVDPTTLIRRADWG